MVASLPGNTVTQNMKTGGSSVKIRNARVRTLSRYSRLVSNQTLRISLAPDYVDEDFVQRWLDQLESIYLSTHQRIAKQLLWISTGRQASFNIVAVVVIRL